MPAPSINSPPFRFCGAERSYFTGKARPALRAKRLYFEEILPTPEAYREILQRTGMMFIPVVVTPEDETWQDTSDIIDALEARFPEPALIPATPVQRIVSYLFEVYADEFMLLPAMHYRWSTARVGEGRAGGLRGALRRPRGRQPLRRSDGGVAPRARRRRGDDSRHRGPPRRAARAHGGDPLRSELPAGRADVAGRLRDDGALLRSPLPRSRSRPDPARARRAREPLGRAHEPPEPGGLHGLPAGRRAPRVAAPHPRADRKRCACRCCSTRSAHSRSGRTRDPRERPSRHGPWDSTRRGCAGSRSLATRARTRCGWCSARSTPTRPSATTSARPSTRPWRGPAASASSSTSRGIGSESADFKLVFERVIREEAACRPAGI